MRILLVGISGAGKSEVAKAWAKARGTVAVDLDEEIEARLGLSVNEIFAQHGERAFRATERLCLEQLSEIDDAVIALGAGAVVENLPRIKKLGSVVWLSLPVATAAERLEEKNDRPLLGADKQARLQKLLVDRRRFYAEADIIIDAEGTPEQVAARGEAALAEQRALAVIRAQRGAYAVRTLRYDDATLAMTLRAHTSAQLLIVCDEAVAARCARIAELASATLVTVPGGERLKRLDAIESLTLELQTLGADRHTVIAAVGGGSVTDAVGFVAACYMRGVEWLSVPSTLLGMVDSGLGGKVGANAGQTKNVIGAFYPPLAVIVDLSWLDSLPLRDRQSGAAEMLKVAATHDAAYFASLATGQAANDLAHVARAAAIKAAVVTADEFEHGERKVLNFGHTLGHAFESVAGLEKLRHGEAVALGMLAETELAIESGEAHTTTFEALRAACLALGLPIDWRAFTEGAGDFLAHDKKRAGTRIRMPIVPEIGRYTWADVGIDRMREFLQRRGASL